MHGMRYGVHILQWRSEVLHGMRGKDVERRMKIGRMEFGKRLNGTDKFHFFYVPVLRPWYHEEFWFFWWIGKKYYICFPKKK